ncbi:autotransporter outer membrane beta-barrel domain-containing protein, partial [Bacteroides ovatus]
GSITAAAVGGAGGAGGFVQKGITATAGGIGGNGGNGGNAYAYGVWCSGAAAVTAVAADTVTATAKAGDAGLGAAVNSGNVLNGVAITGAAGTKGEEAKAYGIYADQGAVIELGEKTTGSGITIGAQATNGETVNEAYAVYAGNGGTVLFHTDAVLNGDGSGGTDNDVVTALADGTLGFSGTSADRSVTGGALRLTGSNEFRVTTDLANNGADKFTFAKLAAGSSTEAQYITVGYDKSFDGSSLSSINGDVTVLTVSDLNGQNLDNFVGKKTTLDNPLERFTATPTVVTNGNDVKITQIDFAKNTDGNTASETAMTLSDAQMAMGSMWRIEGNNLMKRMGELRSDKEAAKGGVWARYYRGELSADSAYDRNFSQDYTAFQGGIDKVQDFKGGKLYTGIAVNRIDSNAGYTAGSGDLSSTGIGLYASWLGSKGHYLDVIARGSKLTNDFKLVDLSGNAAKADYDTWAYGISAEYGYRQNLNAGWFVEPQAELSLGHIGSADYTMSNGGRIENDGVDSAVTRVGILGGKEFTIGGRPSNAYVKASVLHDFGGNGGATGYYGNDSLALQTGDLTGSWYEIGLGANLGIAKNSNLYFDALKTLNSTVRTDWQFNAGLRFTF